MLPEQPLLGVSKEMRYVFFIAAVAVLIAILLSVFYLDEKPVTTAQPEVPIISEPKVVAPEKESLGGALYEKANNPLEDKLPEQIPVSNPLNDAYKNPF